MLSSGKGIRTLIFELTPGSFNYCQGWQESYRDYPAGAYFGEVAAISGKPRSASIVSKGRSTVRRFPGDKLFEIIENYPSISKRLFKIMANRLEHSNEIIMKLAGRKKTS